MRRVLGFVPSAASHRIALVLGAAAVFTVLAGAAALAGGRPLAPYAAALVVEAGLLGSLAVGHWLSRRPWHLELAPAAVSLENMQIVPGYYLERLAALGIFTVTALRRADPEWAALGVGATTDMVRRWQARAELHLLEVREDVLGWAPGPDERWPAIVPGTGAFGRGRPRQGER